MENRIKSKDGYNLSFIMEVVSEVQSGRISMTRAQRKYGIGGNTTIRQWIEKYGKLGKRKTKELDMVSQMELEVEKLKKEKQELESALAKAHLRITSLETLIEVYEEDQKKPGIKKSTDRGQSSDILKKATGNQ